MAIIDQREGLNWVSYNADCVLGMRGLSDESIDFSVFSPPFLSLYIYSDSVADLGNTDSESQFFDGWEFHLKELYRVLKDSKRIAIHCKDTMRYMSSHDYAGLYDFPGQIIRLCESIGFNFERWITVWKDPVIEMQRTKTYGLLHKSFAERAEVTRQGCADYVLVFNKGGEAINDTLPKANAGVVERCIHAWTNESEYINTPLGNVRGRVQSNGEGIAYSFLSKPYEWYTEQSIMELKRVTTPGRLLSIHSTARMMATIIQKLENVTGWKFHSRLSLTDGSFVVTFRNWSDEFTNVVRHNIQPPAAANFQTFEIIKKNAMVIDGLEVVANNEIETWREYYTNGSESHPDYVGTQPPSNWRDNTYYSILLWQRYASPVWFDLPGLPESHPNCWMDIQQTDVLNYRQARTEDEEKHICPLQLGLISKLIKEYTTPGDVVMSPYGGIGSEGYEAVKLRRKAILFELKTNYWRVNCKHLTTADNEITQARLV